MLSERYGAKIVLLACMLVSTLCTFITPVASYYGVWAIVAVRVVMGLAQVRFRSASMNALVDICRAAFSQAFNAPWVAGRLLLSGVYSLAFLSWALISAPLHACSSLAY